MSSRSDLVEVGLGLGYGRDAAEIAAAAARPLAYLMMPAFCNHLNPVCGWRLSRVSEHQNFTIRKSEYKFSCSISH